MANNIQGLISKGISLEYKKGAAFVKLEGLIEVPELGGEKEKIDITTLDDSAKRYTMGLADYGDVIFKFLYDNSADTSNYRVLRGMEKSREVSEFKIVYPDSTSHTFKAQVGVKMDAATVNAPVTFSASLTIQSEIETTNPVAAPAPGK